MSMLRLILRSLVFHRRMHAAVAVGVITATAVLTGALGVGDSMRGSLRRLTLDRLGRIDYVLSTDRFFRATLAERLAAQPGFSTRFAQAVPVILLTVSAENPAPRVARRANQVNLLGCDQRFWQLGNCPNLRLSRAPTAGWSGTVPLAAQFGAHSRPTDLRQRQIVFNEPLATRLGVKAGDRVILRLPRARSVPSDSALGRKTDTVVAHSLTVAAVIPAEGLGRFSLRASQQLPDCAYVPLDWLAQRLEQPGSANTLLVAGRSAETPPSSEADSALARLLMPRLTDYGLHVAQTSRGYLNITCERLILDETSEREILRKLRETRLEPRNIQPALTYLANTIALDDREIPYSTVTAIDFAPTAPLGPWVTSAGVTIPPLADDQIVLNAWAAQQLQAKPGDTVRLTWFEPESHDGQVHERSTQFRLAAIAAMEGAAADPALTPPVPGVTDQLTMAQWNPPFPFDARRIRKQDEDYWKLHQATPKAFVSLATGRKLWQSRFGRTTSLRVAPTRGQSVSDLERQLTLDPAALGFVFQPVKRQGLQSASGTTPFDVLFLAFSTFLILAAVMLIALLFRLGAERRAEEIGTLLALGFRCRRIRHLLASEGLVVAGLASLLGTLAGVGYAALMVAGLRTWWLAAIVTPFLQLHVTPLSLAIGYLSGLIVAAATIAWTVRQALRAPAARLMTGRITEESQWIYRRSRLATAASAGELAMAVTLGLVATQFSEQARAAAFFGAGSLVLAASLQWISNRLRGAATGPAITVGRGTLLRLAVRNAARHPTRSTLSIGLIAAACFLIVSVSAFRIDPLGQIPRLDSGDGGFALVAQTTRPIYQDLNTETGRAEVGFPPQTKSLFQGTQVFALRVQAGDDASCLNLYQPRQPRILGVPETLIQRGGFAWAASDAKTPDERANPWRLLNRDLDPDADGTPRVPVVLEKNTATYALHLSKGVGQTLDVTDGGGRPLRLVVVGLLGNSIFQGDLLIHQRAFLRAFPDTSGYRFFLVRTGPQHTAQLRAALDDTLGDYGLAAETTAQRLAGFLVVQNTYLSTFQSLGGLGLVLGTLGLAAVQLRNVLERRGELALLRAVGFRRRRLGWLVLLENTALLLGGLAAGSLAAAVAVLPHLLTGSASIPWAALAGTLLAVLATGLVAGLAAVWTTVRAPVVAALRGE